MAGRSGHIFVQIIFNGQNRALSGVLRRCNCSFNVTLTITVNYFDRNPTIAPASLRHSAFERFDRDRVSQCDLAQERPSARASARIEVISSRFNKIAKQFSINSLIMHKHIVYSSPINKRSQKKSSHW
jgi:hypothetical protein